MMRHRWLLPVVLALPLVWASTVQSTAARLVVTVTGIHSTMGKVYVALFSTPNGFPDGDFSVRHLIMRATGPNLVVVFDHLRPGRYAVGTYHDENGNSRLDTSFFGYPAEGYALSNGVRAVMHRPRFTDAAFSIDETGTHVTLQMQY